jgi:cyclopropane fatty-acyl-phospholipid synthase-like methyltransferase
MINLCQKKGLKAEIMDIEHLDLKEKYDGIWANASLLHLKKSSLPNLIPKLKSLLNKNGLIYLGVKEGNKEGFEESKRHPNTTRFFSYFTKEEIESQFLDFKQIHFSRGKASEKSTFIRFIFKN